MSGFTIWITGLPGSGKSALCDGLIEKEPTMVLLRMDDLRKLATPSPSYCNEERDMLYRSLIFMAKTLNDLNHDVLIDATGNMRKWRDTARRLLSPFAEVYLRCPLDTCRKREQARRNTRGAPQDIYKKAAGGWPVPGVSAPYEEPLEAELTLDTDKASIEECVSETIKLINSLRERDASN